MIIAFSGYAGAGKDTAAQVLINEYGFEKVSFAQPIKDAIWKLNPLVEVEQVVDTEYNIYGNIVDTVHENYIYVRDLVQDPKSDADWRYAKEFPEVRRLLQVFGTEVGRELFGEDVWVDALFDSLSTTKNYVITDMRFLNEWQEVIDVEGFTVRIAAGKPINTHSSESGLDGVAHHYTIVNNGTIEELQNRVRIICESLDLIQVE